MRIATNQSILPPKNKNNNTCSFEQTFKTLIFRVNNLIYTQHRRQTLKQTSVLLEI